MSSYVSYCYITHFFIQNFAKSLVHADRASLFLLDTKSRELYARIFDTGTTEETVLQKEIRFGVDGMSAFRVFGAVYNNTNIAVPCLFLVVSFT